MQKQKLNVARLCRFLCLFPSPLPPTFAFVGFPSSHVMLGTMVTKRLACARERAHAGTRRIASHLKPFYFDHSVPSGTCARAFPFHATPPTSSPVPLQNVTHVSCSILYTLTGAANPFPARAKCAPRGRTARCSCLRWRDPFAPAGGAGVFVAVVCSVVFLPLPSSVPPITPFETANGGNSIRARTCCQQERKPGNCLFARTGLCVLSSFPVVCVCVCRRMAKLECY